MSPSIPLLLAALALVLLSGCSREPGPEALDNYLERLARPLRLAEPPAPGVSGLPLPPRPGEVRVPIAGDSLGTLDFLALQGCTLQVTIGKMNASLGLVASGSQRLLLALEFLQHAPACLDHLRAEGKASLAAQIEQAGQQRRAQLPALVFNATLGNREYRQLWLPPARLGDYPAATSSAVITALEAVNGLVRAWQAGRFDAGRDDLELLLSEVARGDGGALGAALALQADRLQAANRLLQASLDRGPLCGPNHRDPAATIVDTVVQKFFAGEVQTWSAALERRRWDLLPPLRELEGLLEPVLPPTYRAWRDSRDELLAEWAGAPRRHVQKIQRLLTPCRGAAPGAEN